MSELTAEELALLADDAGPRKPRVKRKHEAEPAAEPASQAAAVVVAAPARGPITPAQWDDDGWGDLPVQSRG